MFKELNILKVFFENPSREYNVRELARILKLSPATMSKELKLLSKEGLIKQKRERNLLLYRPNTNSDLFRDTKIFYTIRKLKESGLVESLNRFYLKPTIILFGSASLGMDTETSDIDVVIISENTKEFPEKLKFEKKLSRSLQIFNVKDLRKLRNEHLINNVLSGIVTRGYIKWI
jgi:predicted nucleotidyltransferase